MGLCSRIIHTQEVRVVFLNCLCKTLALRTTTRILAIAANAYFSRSYCFLGNQMLLHKQTDFSMCTNDIQIQYVCTKNTRQFVSVSACVVSCIVYLPNTLEHTSYRYNITFLVIVSTTTNLIAYTTHSNGEW